MPFLVFKLAFAALVIALLVVAALIWRTLRRKRAAATTAAAPPRAARAAVPGQTPTPAKPAAGAEPTAPTRRRQLRPASQAEEETLTPAPAPALAIVPPAEPDTASSPAPATEAAAAPDVSAQVLARLEAAFDAYQNGDTTLAEYEALVIAEQAAADRALAARQAAGEDLADEDLADVVAARDAIAWCLRWAHEQREPPAVAR